MFGNYEKSTAFFHVSGAIVTREMLGNETIYSIIDKRKNRFVIRQLTDTFRVGDEVTLEVDKNSIYFFGKDEERIRQEHSDYADCIEASLFGGVFCLFVNMLCRM